MPNPTPARTFSAERALHDAESAYIGARAKYVKVALAAGVSAEEISRRIFVTESQVARIAANVVGGG